MAIFKHDYGFFLSFALNNRFSLQKKDNIYSKYIKITPNFYYSMLDAEQMLFFILLY